MPDAHPPYDHDADLDESTPQHVWRRRLGITAIIVAILAVLALIPPLINVGRLRHRIATSMSESLGRPVHLDNVTLHLLPMPGFTLENLVVSEDPAFGYEPVIRANTVEARVRVSSLWRRQVEISSIHFIDPSLNIVRNVQGRWNLEAILMQAAHVNTAPTAQRKAGPTPRFPYIEATGARVNLKLGNEKMPFSLTEADFALWLPSPEQWRVRLQGKPARTDTNASDTGTLHLEGTLQRSDKMSDVPVDLHARWQSAPLGEASRLLTGNDAGWRGDLTVETVLLGKLSAIAVTTAVHLDNLRRADFVPARLLDLAITCHATLNVPAALLQTPECTLPTPGNFDASPTGITATADLIDLNTLQATGLHVATAGLSEEWLLDWARLFSQRIPPTEKGFGTVTANLLLTPATNTTPAVWQGQIQGDTAYLPTKDLPPTNDSSPSAAKNLSSFAAGGGPASPTTTPDPTTHTFNLTLDNNTLTLTPLNLFPPGKPSLLFSGSATTHGYTLHLAGTTTTQQLTTLTALAPPLADNLSTTLPLLADPTPATNPTDKPTPIDVTCTRQWNTPQTCTTTHPEPTTTPHTHHRR